MSKQLQLLKQEKQHLQIISDFAVSLLSINQLDKILWHLAQNVIAKLGFEDVVIYLADEQQKTLHQQSAYGDKSSNINTILTPINIPFGEGVVGKAAQSKHPVLIENTQECDFYIVDDNARLSELAVPMVINDKIIGVIDSEHSRKNFYTQEHKRTLIAIASIAATKISQSQTISELQQTIEKLEYSSKIQDTLFDIAELIFETDSLDTFYKKLHACIGRLTFANNFYIALTTDDGDYLDVPYFADEIDELPPNSSFPLKTDKPSITGYVVNNKKPLLVYEEGLQKLIDQQKVHIIGSLPKAWLGVPFHNKNIKGIVVVQSYSDNYVFQEKDKQLLIFVAKHIRNAIERMQNKEDMRFLALHDPLTTLPNRLLFTDRLEHAISRAQRDNSQHLAVLFLDLDKFKNVNDTFGHHIGDQLLIIVAQKINECLRKSDTLCRLGGDEFAILIENINQQNKIKKIAEKIITAIQTPLNIENFQIQTSTSIGVAFYQKDIDADELLKQADEAMYSAKLNGRNQIIYYDNDEMGEHCASHRVERDFLQALDEQQLYFEFQPIVNLTDHKIIAAEALIRWQHPQLGLIPPNNFIPELEKISFIHHLDHYVLDNAVKFLAEFQHQLPTEFRLHINISGAGFNSSTLLAKLQKVYQKNAGLLSYLCLEITEQSMVDSIAKTKLKLDQYTEMGISIALDDFGTGYSSLNYLDKLTFDDLKIDQAFIQDIEDNTDADIILQTIIHLARSLDIKTTAEGIETEQQLEELTLMQCDHGQGYLFSKPVKQTQFLAWFKTSPAKIF